MTGLSDFRAQHPEYNDMPDQQLTDALYKKFYSDIPRAQFDAKMGVAQPAASPKPTADAPQPSLMQRAEKAVGSINPVTAAKEGVESIAGEYKKEATEGMEDIKGDVTAPVQSHDKQGKAGKPGAMDYAARAGKTALDAAGYLATPVTSAVRQTVGKSAQQLSGGKLDPDAVTNAALIALPASKSKLVSKIGEAVMGDSAAPKAAKTAALASPKIPEGTPLTKAPALTQPRTFEDQLFQLENNRVADRMDALKAVQSVPKGIDWEKLYHFEENPEGVKLTPEEKTVYDHHIAPIKAEATKLSAELEGVEPGAPDEKYTPRYVAERTRSFGEVLNQWKKGVEAKFGGAGSRSLRKTVDAQKSRRMYNAVDPDTGAKTVVHIGTDGKVLGFDGSGTPKQFGEFPRGQSIGAGSKVRAGDKTWILEQATTKEIEDAAKISYNKNLLANRLDNLAKLRSAVRNKNFIEGMKNSPDWEKVAVERSKSAVPPTTNGRQWRTPKDPQFSNYYMEPQVADALDDFKGRTHDLDGLENGLDKAGNIIKGSIFWNPIPHMRNIANMYFTGKGLVGTATSLPSSAKNLYNGFKSVITQDDKYMKALRSGASLPYARYITADLNKALTKKLGEDMVSKPSEWNALAKAWGYANPAEMISRIYKTSNKALWGFGDALTMARLADEEGKGVSAANAIGKVEKDMPSYRIPGQVGGSGVSARFMSQVLSNPIATMFGRYQYHRIAMLGRMAKDMVDSKLPAKERAEAMDKMAMLAVQMGIYYPMMDKAWQKVSGSKDAKVTRPGAATVPQALLDVAKGDRGPGEATASIFSPGAMAETPLEIYHGRYGWDGEPIAYPQNLTDGHPDQFARDIGTYVASKIQPIGQGQRILEGAQSPTQFAMQQIGVTAPTEQQAQSKQYFKNRDATYARRRAQKLAGKRAIQDEKAAQP